MKRKLFYMLVIFFGLSIFSSAKQNGKYCGKMTTCPSGKQNTEAIKELNADAGKGFDLSPLQPLVLGI